MTTPGGVPNLPTGALTLDTLAEKTQDMSVPAMRSRAAERFPSIFDSSSGGNALNDLTPFGILTQLFSGFNSAVANADPADIQGPDDLPGLLLDFIESLPVIGELVGLLEAILGTYDGDDPVLLQVQAIFAPIRAIVDALTGLAGGEAGLTNFFPDLLGILGNPIGLGTGSTTLGGLGSIPILGPMLGLFGGAANATQATNYSTNLLSFLGNPTLTGSTGAFNPTSVATNFINTVLNPTGLMASVTGIIDMIFAAITGVARDPAGNPTTDLNFVLGNIPFANVLGIGGPANIGLSVQSTWDQTVSGLVGLLGTGSSLADLFNTTQQVSSNAALGGFSWDILGIRNNRSLNTGFLPTTQSNVGLDTVALQGSAPTFALTQSTAITGYHRISQASNYGVVSWHGSGVTSITDAFVNIYKMDTTTGDNTLVHASSNIVGSLSGSMQQNVYTIPTPIPVAAGEVYGVELAVRGAGTHSVVGASSWLPDQSVYPRRFSSVRNSGTSAAPATVTPSYGSNVPFIEFGVTAGTTALPHSPEIRQFSTAGTTSYPIPTWCNFVDRVVLGGGGGGHQGATLGVGGAGGDAASWESDTLARGTHFTGSASLTTVVGAGGAGGAGNGGDGGTSSSNIGGSYTISSAGGPGSTSLDILGTQHAGASPGDYAPFPTIGPVWTIAGGAVQNSYGAAGNPAGGAGAGGNWISLQFGGAGAPGTILYRFRQN